jgi:hypothetical protein
VTKFTQTTIFSGLNNLDDLTLNENYASICGFTLNEFDSLFSEHIEETLRSLKSQGTLQADFTTLDLRQLILDWYDGYSWDGETRVLNPWSILKFFYRKKFANYWAQTGGAPTLIADLAKSGKVTFDKLIKPEPIIERMNVIELGNALKPVPLMFQAGYLTVKRVDETKRCPKYYLGLPNLEVKANIIPFLLSLDPIRQPWTARTHCKKMLNSLINRDKIGFEFSFGRYLSQFYYSAHETHEANCQARFQSAMAMAEADLVTDGSIGDGKYDTSYTAPDGTIFLFELKYCSLKGPKGSQLSEAESKVEMEKSASAAMKQIDELNYTKPFRGTVSLVYKVALVIGGRSEVLVLFEKEEAN